jgi:hypothetical protein
MPLLIRLSKIYIVFITALMLVPILGYSEDDVYSNEIFNSELKDIVDYRIRQGEYFIRKGKYELALEKLYLAFYDERVNQFNLKALLLLLEAHWRLGDDQEVLALAEYLPSEDEARVWSCRVLERNIQHHKGHACWNSISEITRARRTLRSELTLDILYE